MHCNDIFRPGSIQWEHDAVVSSNHRVRRTLTEAPRMNRRIPKGIGEDFIRGAFKAGIYGSNTLMELKKYGTELVRREMKILSVEEFGIRYGLI